MRKERGAEIFKEKSEQARLHLFQGAGENGRYIPLVTETIYALVRML